MNKETYERMNLVITEFDSEDIIITSGEEFAPELSATGYEVTTGGQVGTPTSTPLDF